MKKFVSMGEIMLRLSTPGFKKIEQSQSFDAGYGGGEANVAVSLAQFGLCSTFITKVPNNPLGRSVVNYLRQHNVNTDHIIYGGERLGIYYLEKGHSIRSSKVVYDRKYSSFSTLEKEEYQFADIFDGMDWFHISGITPALNDELFNITKESLKVAKEKGLTTSCDLNYRSALWSFEDARNKMSELMKYVDVCIGVEPLQLIGEDGKDIKDNLPQHPSIDDYKEIIEKLHEQYGFQHVAMTFRENFSVNHNRLYALLSDGNEFYKSDPTKVEIVDRVGAGDAFSAGIIYSLINNIKPQKAIQFAASCFALKHTIEGDVNLLQVSDIEQFMEQKDSMTIKR